MPGKHILGMIRLSKQLRAICALGLAIALVLHVATAVAQTAASQQTWQMTTEYPQSSVSGIGLVSFAKHVSDRTGGQLTVTAAFDNQLKISSSEMPRATNEGRITGGDAFAGAVFGLSTLPFVVPSVDVARAVNARARPLYEQALRAQGLKLLYLTIWPSTGLWSDRPLGDVAALQQLSMRTYDDSSADVMRAAGSAAEFLPMGAAMDGLKARKLNAFLTSGDGGVGRKLWDYLPYFTAIHYAMPVTLAFVRSDTFDALPAEAQKQVLAAAAETEQSQFELLGNRTAENYARMRESGVTITEPAPAAVAAALRAAAASPVAAWKARAGSEAVAIIDWAVKQ
jgi:TRAP-type C4-dicarboxylate transport system substrate-binding protein